MYVLTHNDFVILGPIAWNSRMFSSAIEEETGIEVSVLQSEREQVPVNKGNGIKIRNAVESRPQINTKIQHYSGPYWSFTDSTGTASYVPTDKNIDLVKSELGAKLASVRYDKEIAGVKVTVQDLQITVDTARGSRDVFVQQFLLMGDTDTVTWKFPEGWLNLSKTELGICVSAGVEHVKAAFVWEATKLAEVNACNTLTELNLVAME